MGTKLNNEKEQEQEDLFETPELLPPEVLELLESYTENNIGYNECANLLAKLNKLGYTFEYDLDGCPYNLTKL